MDGLVWLVVILSILLIAAGALIWKIGVRSQRPKRLPNEQDPNIEVRLSNISFDSHGSRLEGWLLNAAAAGEEPSPLVIVAHGWGSNRTRALRYAKPLCEAGYAVFMYDARSHGDSESIAAPSALMFREDVLAAVEAARGLDGIDPERIVLLGHSLGGFGSVLALAEGVRVRGIITDSMPVRFETMLEAELKRNKLPLFPLAYLIPAIWLLRAGITREQLRKASVPHILRKYAIAADTARLGWQEETVANGETVPLGGRMPVLMLHSDGDDFIPAADLRRLERELPAGTIQAVYVATTGHSSSERDPVFWSAVLPFIEKAIGSSRRA